MNTDKIQELKNYLEVLEKARSVEKEARTRLQREGLPSDEQEKWAGILKAASAAVDALERGLEKVLETAVGSAPKVK